MSTTRHCLIEPRDPLIFRDGRPFAAGIAARSQSWPFPTVVAGTARTQLGLPGPFDDALVEKLLEVRQRGPLLSYRAGESWELALPRPHDAAAFPAADDDSGKVGLYPCRPSPPTKHEGTDLDTCPEPPLRGLMPACAALPKGKPSNETPDWWRWGKYKQWLQHRGPGPMTVGKDGLGVRAPIPDSRVHVRIDPAASAAMEGQLFATEGLDFDSREEPLALYSEFTLPEGLEAGRLTGAISLGGERRLAIWHDSPSLLAGLVSPKELLETIVRDRQMRLILVTPGCFKDGWMPGWLAKDGRPPVAGCLLQMRLRAAAAGRFVPISGWDLKDRRPKPTRFLSPAGAVFFVSIDGQVTVEQLSKLWLQPVSDADQDRRDGFGLCILGAWGE